MRQSLLVPLGRGSFWSPQLAYAVGLLATDGCLSKDGRHINFTSKDLELVQAFQSCLGLSQKIGRTARGGEREKKYFVAQFGNRDFYDFLLSIGLTPAKSKTIGALCIPDRYFPDFLRGCFDGDGNFQVFHHPQSRFPQLSVRLYSASQEFLNWTKSQIASIFGVTRGWISQGNRSYVLHYGKGDSIRIFSMLYYPGVGPFLARKRHIADQFLAGVAELV